GREARDDDVAYRHALGGGVEAARDDEQEEGGADVASRDQGEGRVQGHGVGDDEADGHGGGRVRAAQEGTEQGPHQDHGQRLGLGGMHDEGERLAFRQPADRFHGQVQAEEEEPDAEEHAAERTQSTPQRDEEPNPDQRQGVLRDVERGELDGAGGAQLRAQRHGQPAGGRHEAARYQRQGGDRERRAALRDGAHRRARRKRLERRPGGGS